MLICCRPKGKSSTTIIDFNCTCSYKPTHPMGTIDRQASETTLGYNYGSFCTTRLTEYDRWGYAHARLTMPSIPLVGNMGITAKL